MLPPSLLTGPPSDAADAAWAELEKRESPRCMFKSMAQSLTTSV